MIRLRQPFSYEHHRDAADLLVRLRADLERLGQALGASDGESAAGEAQNAVAARDKVREMLDDQLDRDFPRDPDQVCNIRLGSIYYPPRWRKAG